MWLKHEHITLKRSGNQYSRLCRQLLRGSLFRHNECVRDQTSCKVNVGKKLSSLDLNIFPSAPGNCFCFGPSTWYLFANHKESQRSRERPLCLCTVSAAVTAKIVLKSMMHMCQLSSCHLKVSKARIWKEIFARNFSSGRTQCVYEQCGPAGKQAPVTEHKTILELLFGEVGTLLKCPWAAAWMLTLQWSQLHTDGC